MPLGSDLQDQPLRFGAFELDIQSGELRKHGHRIRTPNQSLQVLKVLLERPGEIVEREELYRKLWPNDVFVDFERSLNASVRKLRRSLRDSAAAPRYIETIPRRGYTFIGKLEEPQFSPTAVPVDGSVAENRTMLSTPESDVVPAQTARGRRTIAAWAAACLTLAGAAFSFHAYWGRNRSHFDWISIERVTATGDVTAAAISPDGRYVIYASSNRGRESLRMRQLATATEMELIPAADVSYRKLVFSPDGDLIYYVKDESGRLPSLYSKPLLGGAEKKILENVPGPGDLSPDGKSFTFIRNLASGESTLMVARVDGSEERKLAVRHHPSYFGSSGSPRRRGVPYLQTAGPAWSPDGTQIACCTFRSALTSGVAAIGFGDPDIHVAGRAGIVNNASIGRPGHNTASTRS
jgi:DNA-binding winged helix-turn-helix (wHTH) protein